MSYVIVIAVLGLAIGLALGLSKSSEEEYPDYEKIDADPKWNQKHLVAIVLLAFLMILNTVLESYDKLTMYLFLAASAFMIFVLVLDIRDPKNRYIYINRNKIVVNGEMIDRKTIKGYRISGIFKNAEIVTYNGNKYRINRAQKRKMDELAKSHHFPWQQVA